MKRFWTILTILAMVLSFTGCGASLKGDYVFNDGLKGDIAYEGSVAAPGSSVEIRPSGTETPNKPDKAGTLTAGEWKDADDLEFWTKLLNQNDWYPLLEQRNLYTNDVITVFVHDTNGAPCYNAEVKLCSDAQCVYVARTDVEGKAYLLRNLHKDDEKANCIKVGKESFDIPENKTVDVTAESTGITVEMLDLMLMIDTTGSMTDELVYLQKELEDVIERVADAGKTLSINVSVNFYRDEHDDYVVKSFEFTSDIAAAIATLNEQRTDGGGDYPEAVHKALNNAVNEHQWRNNAVKLMFFVLDAPPHHEAVIKGINNQMTENVKAAAEKGIRIIPLASSGVDVDTEFLMRSWALMTGGTYIFLTDDSGVGNDHLEPTIGEHKVEKLNECMIRVISEYCGLEYKAPSENQR